MSPAGWTLAGHQPIVTSEILGELWRKVPPLLQYGRVGQYISCTADSIIFAWCDSVTWELFNPTQSISTWHAASLNIRILNGISGMQTIHLSYLSAIYIFVYLMPCLVKSWHSVDPTQYVVLLLADLQHISADYAYFSLVVYQDTGKGESTKPMPLGATREILHIHTILIRAYPALKKNRVSCPRISIITLWWICSLSTFKCIRPFTVQLKPGHYPRW